MDSDDDADSLFDSEDSRVAGSNANLVLIQDTPIASRLPPSIPGLFFFPELLPRHLHDHILRQVSACDYFALQEEDVPSRSGHTDVLQGQAYQRSPRNQAMLFARSLPNRSASGQSDASRESVSPVQEDDLSGCSGLPPWAVELIRHLEQLLVTLPEHQLPAEIKSMLFPAEQVLSRQLILNLYNGAEGLASHVDLVNRFADGILLCSFGPQGTGTVMDFTHESRPSQHLFLPSGSVLLLSGESRYDWKHGIVARPFDLVQSADHPDRIDSLKRSIRLSITIRSMLPGADIVGE